MQATLPTYIGKQLVKIKEYEENVLEFGRNQEAISSSMRPSSSLSLEVRIFPTQSVKEGLFKAGHPKQYTYHIAQDRLGHHPVHVKSADKGFSTRR
jgi:hypothetical protein